MKNEKMVACSYLSNYDLACSISLKSQQSGTTTMNNSRWVPIHPQPSDRFAKNLPLNVSVYCYIN